MAIETLPGAPSALTFPLSTRGAGNPTWLPLYRGCMNEKCFLGIKLLGNARASLHAAKYGSCHRAILPSRILQGDRVTFGKRFLVTNMVMGPDTIQPTRILFNISHSTLGEQVHGARTVRTVLGNHTAFTPQPSFALLRLWKQGYRRKLKTMTLCC